jgi:hypothetical protein
MRTASLLSLAIALPASEVDVPILANPQRMPVGALAVAEGGAVVARVDDATAAFNNPAGLARLSRASISGSLSVLEYNRTLSRADGGSASSDAYRLTPSHVGWAGRWDETADAGATPGWALSLAAPVDWACSAESRASTDTAERLDTGSGSYSCYVPAIAAGWTLPAGWTLGGAFEGWMTQYRHDLGTTISSTADDITTVRTVSESGRALHLRLALGTQWQGANWAFGAVLRTPGISVSDQGEARVSSMSSEAGTSVQTMVDDSSVGFDLRHPWAATCGLAWRPIDELVLEGDVAVQAGIGERTIIDQATGTAVVRSAGGTSSTTYVQPERTATFAPTLGLRGGLAWTTPWHPRGGDLAVHLGGWIDPSPVEDGEVFTSLDLLGGSLGLSYDRGPSSLIIAGSYITSGSLTDALGYLQTPEAGFDPALSDPGTRYSLRTFAISIGSTYRF